METGACSHTAASINLVQFLSCGELAVLQRRVDLANIFTCYRFTRQEDQQCNALWYLDNEHLQICKADIAAKSLIYFKTIFYTAFYIDILTYLKNLTPK